MRTRADLIEAGKENARFIFERTGVPLDESEWLFRNFVAAYVARYADQDPAASEFERLRAKMIRKRRPGGRDDHLCEDVAK